MHFSAISQWAYWFFFLRFRFSFIRFRKTPDLLRRANVKFRAMFPRPCKSRFLQWNKCRNATWHWKPIESAKNNGKGVCMIANYFHGEYARGYANVRCIADLWFMHRQNEYAEISEPKMKMVARCGHKIAADVTCWECSWLEIASVMKKREEEYVRYETF